MSIEQIWFFIRWKLSSIWLSRHFYSTLTTNLWPKFLGQFLFETIRWKLNTFRTISHLCFRWMSQIYAFQNEISERLLKYWQLTPTHTYTQQGKNEPRKRRRMHTRFVCLGLWTEHVLMFAPVNKSSTGFLHFICYFLGSFFHHFLFSLSIVWLKNRNRFEWRTKAAHICCASLWEVFWIRYVIVLHSSANAKNRMNEETEKEWTIKFQICTERYGYPSVLQNDSRRLQYFAILRLHTFEYQLNS